MRISPSLFGTALISALFIGSFASNAFGQIQKARVTGGEVSGVVKDGVASFKGVPFAAPPVGALRWKAPQPVIPWTGVRKADTFAAAPMQAADFAKQLGADKVSEDCLYLNVWTPAKRTDEKLPVMVWIYGGAGILGATSQPEFDGTRLAQKGVVFVSVAYRLGPFGFLAHPELSVESGGKGSGCYGIQDQIAGLKWVHDNISQFGGDPTRVTIFGESAGGIAVSILAASPSAKGLFQRAIAESGVSMAAPRRDNEPASMVESLKLGEKSGEKFLSQLGAKDIAAARAASADQVEKAIGGWLAIPVVDGATIVGDPYELCQAGRFNDTPILVGYNSDDGSDFASMFGPTSPKLFEKNARAVFGPAAEALLSAYPHASYTDAIKSTNDAIRDMAFGWPAWAWATLQTQNGKNKAFVYYFDHRTKRTPNGARHASEIPYVFRNRGGFFEGFETPDAALADTISTYWVNFAKTGDPNSPGLPTWPAFDEKTENTMVFTTTIEAKPFPNLENIRKFDDYFKWLRSEARK